MSHKPSTILPQLEAFITSGDFELWQSQTLILQSLKELLTMTVALDAEVQALKASQQQNTALVAQVLSAYQNTSAQLAALIASEDDSVDVADLQTIQQQLDAANASMAAAFPAVPAGGTTVPPGSSTQDPAAPAGGVPTTGQTGSAASAPLGTASPQPTDPQARIPASTQTQAPPSA